MSVKKKEGITYQLLTAAGLVKVLGVYSCLVIGLISILTLASDAGAAQKATIKMALGLILFWVIIGGWLMIHFRDPLRRWVLAIPLPWQLKFPLFCTALALLEEGITVTMTNLAPIFGVKVGEAFITASSNYLDTVLFHSVIVFIPMFLTWTVMLHFLDFPATHVFLLFGLTGSLAEMSMSPTNILGGFWFFVYGLMVYLPAYSLPDNRAVKKPAWWHYLLGIALPLFSPILLLPFVPLLKHLWSVRNPVFFVDSAWD